MYMFWHLFTYFIIAHTDSIIGYYIHIEYYRSCVLLILNISLTVAGRRIIKTFSSAIPTLNELILTNFYF